MGINGIKEGGIFMSPEVTSTWILRVQVPCVCALSSGNREAAGIAARIPCWRGEA